MKCDEQVVPLVKSLTNEVNKNEGRAGIDFWIIFIVAGSKNHI